MPIALARRHARNLQHTCREPCDIPQLSFTSFDPNDFTQFNSNTSANYSSNTTDFVDDIKAAKINVEHPLELPLLESDIKK